MLDWGFLPIHKAASFLDRGGEDPMIVKEQLQSGLTLITETMPHVRSVATGVWLKRGSRHERASQAGISHFIEHMVFKGTQSRSAQQLAAEVDSIGGHMDAFTAKEYAAFHLKVLDQHLPLAVDILADIVVHPLFDPEEVAKEKKVIFEEINMIEDTPDELVMELFSQAFWPDHPLGRPILGTKDSVASFERDQIEGFFREAYRPENLLVVAAGNLEHEPFSRLLQDRFGGLTPGQGFDAGTPPRPTAALVSRSKQELEQVHLCLGGRAYHQNHEGRYVTHVLNTVLGGSMSSRLFQNIREQRGLVYSISSGVAAYSDAGHLTVCAGTSLDALDEVVRLTLEELRRLKQERIPEAELRRAKDHLKGSLMLSLESTGNRMGYLARQEIYFGRLFSLDETLQGIEAVADDDVQQIAEELFSGDLTMSLLGDLSGYQPSASALRV
jgi:predicted Zn-dependent peptidase